MKRLLGFLTLALLAGVASSALARADVTKRFCIDGTSDGAGWTWELNGIGLPAQRVTTPGVPAGGSATDLAQQWVRSINAAQGTPPGYVAKFDGTGEDGKAYFTVTATRNFSFKVGDCTITGNREGCSFNPTVLEVDDGGNGNGNGGGMSVPLIVVIIIVGVVIIIIIIVRRRRPRP